MKLAGKIFLTAGLALIVMGLGFFIDVKIFDRGEENRAPDVGIKAAAVEPKFATANSQPVVSVFIKGEAARVWLEVAPRINSTSGGETLAIYDLEPFESLPAGRINPEDSGEVRRWALVVPVPADEGQYLLTAHAIDVAGRETKFKIFNSILVVQPIRDQLAGETPGQSTILKFVDFLKAGKADDAAELLTAELRETIVPEKIFDSDIKEITVNQFELWQLSLREGEERDLMVMTVADKGERQFSIDLQMNHAEPLSKWLINKVEKLK